MGEIAHVARAADRSVGALPAERRHREFAAVRAALAGGAPQRDLGGACVQHGVGTEAERASRNGNTKQESRSAFDSRNAVLQAEDHLEFAQAEYYLLARQLQEALQEEHEEEEEEEEQQEEEEEDVANDVVIPIPGQVLTTVGAASIGTGQKGFQDGAAAHATFGSDINMMLCLPDGRVLVADEENHLLRMLSADLQQVSTVAGDGEAGHRDGAAAQAQFSNPGGLALLPDGRVLLVDGDNYRIRMLSADLQQVSTVEGDGEEGHRDGAAAHAHFNHPCGLALLPDGCVLMADQDNLRLRMLSADLQQVSTVVGDGEQGHQDGAAAQAQFHYPRGLALLPDRRVLVADMGNNRIVETLV